MQQWARKESPRGTRMTFPFQLHALLSQAETLRLNGIISWLPTGDKFVILKPNEFAQRILPKVFRQTKFSSFKRQLNAYGFQREITSHLELDKLVYYNDNFHRDRPGACGQITRRRPGDAPTQSTRPTQSFTAVSQGNSYSNESLLVREKPSPSVASNQQNEVTASNLNYNQGVFRLEMNPNQMGNLHYQSHAGVQEETLSTAISTQPQYLRPDRPDSRNEQIGLTSTDLAKVTSFGVNDSVLDELAESVSDEGVKGKMGKWDPQIEASLSRTSDEHFQGIK